MKVVNESKILERKLFKIQYIKYKIQHLYTELIFKHNCTIVQFIKSSEGNSIYDTQGFQQLGVLTFNCCT